MKMKALFFIKKYDSNDLSAEHKLFMKATVDFAKSQAAFL